ncbi:MAG: PTS sugar transporter subunit IIA [Myxococcota bacterium]
MKIVDILSEDLIVPELESKTRDAVLRELVAAVVRVHPIVPVDGAVRVLADREDIGSTGVGQGLAIPHAKLRRLSRAVAVFGRSSAGIDFQARDGQPCHLFLALLAPEGNAGVHLKALARASRLFKESAFLQALRDAPPDQVWPLIRAKDAELG